MAGGLLTGVAGAQGNATDEAEIRRVLELQVDAFNIADAAALARDFTRDADFVGIAGDHCQGRDDIERKHVTWFATKFRGSRLELRSTALRQKTHSSAVVDVEYLMTGYQAPAEGSLPSGPIRARMKFVFTRERQRWLVVSARQLELAPATPN